MEIQINKSSTIQPVQETPRHCIRTSDLDLLGRAAHVPMVYFYKRPNDSFNFFEPRQLKEALSKVLVPFHPLAGRLGRDENGRIEIHCNEKSVLFMEAETSCVIDDLGDFESSLELLKLVPSVDYTKDISTYPMLVSQLTRFKCGGVCLGVGLHHTLADATSVFHFINAWTEITRGIPISIPPFIDRTILGVGVPVSPKFHHIEYDPPPSLNSPAQVTESQSNPKPISSAILKLSPDQINILKTKSKKNEEPDIKYTTFEILAAHIWRCLCKARQLYYDQASKLHVPINGRSRLNPPIPAGYVGNVIFTATSVALSGDIQLEPLNFTIERIHKALKRMDEEYSKSALAYVKQHPDPTVLKRGAHTFKWTNLNISNLFNLPIYDANFGSGRPMFMRPVALSDGVAHILPSPSNDGSLFLVMNLETQHIELFKKFPYEIFRQCQSPRSGY